MWLDDTPRDASFSRNDGGASRREALERRMRFCLREAKPISGSAGDVQDHVGLLGFLLELLNRFRRRQDN
jgi:hypothetical protein